MSGTDGDPLPFMWEWVDGPPPGYVFGLKAPRGARWARSQGGDFAVHAAAPYSRFLWRSTAEAVAFGWLTVAARAGDTTPGEETPA